VAEDAEDRLAAARYRATLALRGCSIDTTSSSLPAKSRRPTGTRLIARNGQERRELEHGIWNCEVV
jgi:hypothetical protein